MSVAHTGTPRTKFCVPSIGSITHCLAAVPVEPSSSPIIPSRVRTRESCARRSSSTSRSTSVTGVPSLLCSTVKDRSLNRDMLTRSTLSARICASLKSSVYDVVKFMNLSLVVKCYRVWSMVYVFGYLCTGYERLHECPKLFIGISFFIRNNLQKFSQ